MAAVHLIGVVLGAHGCHQADGDVRAALHVPFMHIGARSQSIVGQSEDGPVSRRGGRVVILHAPGLGPARGRVVEHQALDASRLQIGVDLVHVGKEIRVGVVITPDHPAIAGPCLVPAGEDLALRIHRLSLPGIALVEEHVSGKFPGVILRPVAGLKIGQRDPAQCGHRLAPLLGGFIGFHIASVLDWRSGPYPPVASACRPTIPAGCPACRNPGPA